MRQAFLFQLPSEVRCRARIAVATHDISLADGFAAVTDCRTVITRSAVAYSCGHPFSGSGSGTLSIATNPSGNEMSSSNDLTKMTDPEFLAERRRVREELEHTPEQEVSAALTDLFEKLNEEFLRRARISWSGNK